MILRSIIFLLLIPTFLQKVVYAQKVSVAAMKQNTAIIGVENPLSIMVENCSCNNLSVSTDNGTIRRYENCGYDFKPARLGMAQILISCKGGRGVTNYLLRVVKENESTEYTSTIEPMPAAGVHIIIDRKHNGPLKKSALLARDGLAVNSVDKGQRYTLNRFTMAILRGEQIIFSKTSFTSKFTGDMRSFISTIQIGDKVVFFNMVCSSGKIQLILPSAEFTIIE